MCNLQLLIKQELSMKHSIPNPRDGRLATVALTPMEAQIDELRSVTLSLSAPDKGTCTA